MGRMYMATLEFTYNASNAPMDVLEIVPAVNQLVIVHEIVFGQSDVETSEALVAEIWIGYTTSGSGGATPVPQKLSQGDPVSGLTTFETGNTTPATTAGVKAGSIPWNALSGFHYLPTPEGRFEITGSDRWVLHLPDDPTNAQTAEGFVLFEVRGG